MRHSGLFVLSAVDGDWKAYQNLGRLFEAARLTQYQAVASRMVVERYSILTIARRLYTADPKRERWAYDKTRRVVRKARVQVERAELRFRIQADPYPETLAERINAADLLACVRNRPDHAMDGAERVAVGLPRELIRFEAAAGADGYTARVLTARDVERAEPRSLGPMDDTTFFAHLAWRLEGSYARTGLTSAA